MTLLAAPRAIGRRQRTPSRLDPIIATAVQGIGGMAGLERFDGPFRVGGRRVGRFEPSVIGQKRSLDMPVSIARDPAIGVTVPAVASLLRRSLRSEL